MTSDLTIASQIAEYTTIAQNIVLALSGVAAVIIAYLGLTTWRKELKGKSEYAKAKEVLKAVYKVRRAFSHVRHPAIYPYEYPEEMRDDHWGFLKPEYTYEGTRHVYENRWKYLSEAFQELEEQNLDAQVEWGPSYQDVIVPLRKCKAELQIAIETMLYGKKGPYEKRERTSEELQHESSVLYDHFGKDPKHDKFTLQINEAVEKFEKKLRPYIKK